MMDVLRGSVEFDTNIQRLVYALLPLQLLQYCCGIGEAVRVP